jgi:hypothetical protein
MADYHDHGRTSVNVSFSAPRSGWQPVAAVPGKVSQVVSCDHLHRVAGVPDPDWFATAAGQITHASIHDVEGLPTGASLGVVVGHNTPEGFKPLSTRDTVGHVDVKGDTHVYHDIKHGKGDKGGREIEFAPMPDHEVVAQDTLVAREERWKGVRPDDVKPDHMFEAVAHDGKKKAQAVVDTGSALGGLISRNLRDSAFTKMTGTIGSVTDDGKDFHVLNAETAVKLAKDVGASLRPQNERWQSPLAVQLMTDAEVLKGTGNAPFNLKATFGRKNAKMVPVAVDGDKTAPEVSLAQKTKGVDSKAVPLAQKVFGGEADKIVSISTMSETAGGD